MAIDESDFKGIRTLLQGLAAKVAELRGHL
jgi:hypothetical protein